MLAFAFLQGSLIFFPQILSAQKENMFSNWESEDGLVFY